MQQQQPLIINQGSQDSSLLSEFANAQTKNEIAELLKELFDEKKIFMITDVTRDEAVIMTRIYMVAKMKNIDIWIDGLQFYASILLSKNRKSRSELINAISSASMGVMNKMGNAMGFGQFRR